jgi:hypothetical protein
MSMRRLGGAAALLVLGLIVSARAADDGTMPSSGGHWYDKLNPFASKKAEVPQIPPTVPVSGNTTATAGVKPAVLDREGEEAAFLRRTQVCDRLKQIGFDTDNKELQLQAEALQQRAWDLYKSRSAMAPMKFESDEAVLNQHLGTGRSDLLPTERPRTDSRTAILREDRE